jgi:hypothetical protein
VCDPQGQLGHHLDKVTIGQLVAQVSAYTENDDLLFEVAAP